MGAGKSTVGRRLAQRLNIPFVDSDEEIETAADCTIADYFELYGEPEFRALEKRVIERLLRQGPMVLATGGGAFINALTRERVLASSTAIWLNANLDVLVERTTRRGVRPLLDRGDPRETLRKLMDQRYPVYGKAHIIIDTSMDSMDSTVEKICNALNDNTGKILMTDTIPKTLRVDLGDRSYDIVVGQELLKRANTWIVPALTRPRAVIITDENVARLYLKDLVNNLRSADIRVDSITLPAGEQTKSFAQFEALSERLLEMKVERTTTLIALGGGVIGDLVGFTASTTLRGMPFIQVPTTLLSQVDSSVGGKTGINTRFGKNLVGAFYQPKLVLADTDVLTTLDRCQLLAGYAEVVKYGFIDDLDFFEWLESNAQGLLDGDMDKRQYAILTSCRAKARVVAEDERELGKRALLNLGHTFGHALEAETGYNSNLLHGEAVAIGMAMAFDISKQLGFCTAQDVERAISHMKQLGLPTDFSTLNTIGWTADVLLNHMSRDKKVEGGKRTLILPKGIGETFITSEVHTDDLWALLDRWLS
ncbi:MAG: 3-dehydroquinate synthase [Magnetovibrio sp.]|nr:3-dehydroquinate synthase [Magnetovibrio sp.]